MGRTDSIGNIANNGGHWIAKKRRQAIYRRDNYKCAYCGKYVETKYRTLDHILPQELGGDHYSKNLVLACNTCNAQKGKKSLRLFFKWLQTKKIDTNLIRKRIRNRKRRKLIL